MAIPIICFDIDGTLLNHGGRIHPNDIVLLNQPPREVVLVPNTGRPLSSLRPVFQTRGVFAHFSKLPLPLVLQNGGVVYRPGEQIAAAMCFEPEVQAELLDLVKPLTHVTTILSTADTILEMNPTPFGDAAARLYEFDARIVQPDDPLPPLIKFMEFSDTYEDLLEIARLAEGIHAAAAFSMPTIYEFTPAGVDKASGLRRLQQELGLEDSPVYAAGDGGNDEALLDFADYAFCPSTSPAEVQVQADQIIDVSREGLLIPMLRAAGVLIEG